jgi:hypothetical protein
MLGILPTRDIDDVEAFFHKRGYIAEPTCAPFSPFQGPIAPRSVDQEAIDYSLLRGWVNHCQEWHHGIFCPPSQVDPTWPIRLIDCKTRLVIEVAHLTRPCPPFLALSYVWGQVVDQPDRPSDHSQPLEHLSRTVRDSMVVTLRLGFRYL